MLNFIQIYTYKTTKFYFGNQPVNNFKINYFSIDKQKEINVL